MDTRTVQVSGAFGGTKHLTIVEFVERWVSHASELKALGIDVVEPVASAAGDEFDRLHKAQSA